MALGVPHGGLRPGLAALVPPGCSPVAGGADTVPLAGGLVAVADGIVALSGDGCAIHVPSLAATWPDVTRI